MEGEVKKQLRRTEVHEALESVREMSSEAAREKETAKETVERARAATESDRQAESDVRKALETAPAGESSGPYRRDLYSDFAGERRADGKIKLAGAAAEAAEKGAAEFRRGAKTLNNPVAGEKTAAEYDNRTNTYSSQTRILELPGGEKVFAMYNRGTGLHRFLDTAMKRAYGLPMRKATVDEWKTRVEEKSPRPPIVNEDPHTVLLPHVPLVSGHDVFRKNKDIDDFGQFDWAKSAGLAEKMELLGNLTDEVKRVHAEGTAWGEMILPHADFTADKKAVLREPELRYDQDVPLPEAKARDLRDLCLSVAGALQQAEGQDVGVSVKAILDRYQDAEVIQELKKVASEKKGFFRNLFFGYEKERTGVTGKKQHAEILSAIAAYESPEAA